MKRIVFVFALIICFIAVFAQKSSVTSCWNCLKHGDIAKAKGYCDAAAVNPKTINWYKTWWYYGMTYQNIGTSEDEAVKNIDPDPLTKAFDAYMKAMVLNFKDPQFHTLDIQNKMEDMIKFSQLMGDKNTVYVDNRLLPDLLMSKLPTLSNALINKGAKEFSDLKEFKKAYESFGKSLFLSSMTGKIDTQIVFYSALAAQKAEMYEEAIQSYKAVIAVKFGEDERQKANMYLNLTNMHLANKDTANAVETIQKGIEAYPASNDDLMVFLINHYLNTGKEQEAYDYLKKAIENTHENASFHYALGTLYDKKIEICQTEKQPDKVRESRINAAEAYKNTIKLKPDHVDALFNLGAIYYNWGKDLFEEGDAERDDNKRKAIKEKSDEKYKEAMNCFEKAHEFDSSDRSTIRSLKSLYYRFQMMDKYNEMKKKLEE